MAEQQPTPEQVRAFWKGPIGYVLAYGAGGKAMQEALRKVGTRSESLYIADDEPEDKERR